MDNKKSPFGDALLNIKKRICRLYYIVIKLPLMLFAIVLGFILDAIFALPFMMLLFLNYRGIPGKSSRPRNTC